MKPSTLNKSKFIKKLMAFFGLPLVFVFLAYLIVFMIASPVIAPAASLFSMIIGDKPPTFEGLKVDDDTVDFVDFNAQQSDVISVDDVVFPKVGQKYAHITIENTGVDCDVYYGDANPILKKGPGQYESSRLPGFGSTTLVAAHVTTHFKGLQYVNIGDIINYTTTYGAYKYKVTDVLVVKATEARAVYDLLADYDNLVLYTCYPFYSVAFRSQRYFVLAEKISGPSVDYYVD